MEKTVASRFWTGLTLFCIELKRSEKTTRKKDCLTKEMFSSTGRIAFKGQVFSAPLDHESIARQLTDMEKDEPLALPVDGPALAARCRVWISSGLTDLNKLLKQATIRRNVVMAYIKMKRDSGHPDFVYSDAELKQIKHRVNKMAPSDAPTIPNEVLPNELAEVIEGDDGEDFLGMNKAATPEERASSEAQLESNMKRSRPQILMAQRNSDACKEVRDSRLNAFEQFSEMKIGTSSSLLDQFESNYPGRAFHTSLPWCAGGPDFGKNCNPRRAKDEDAPKLSPESYTNMTASRVEYNIRSDWDLLPGMWTLNFASKVNTMVSMSMQRCLRRGTGPADRLTDRAISLATERLYTMLWKGECEMSGGGGQRIKINGDLAKLPHAVGLTDIERALIQNYHFMSSMLAGTRQVRRKIRNLLFSSLVVYGTPVFLTFSPSERHSGVAIRLYRGRRNDPAYTSSTHDAKDFKDFIGYNTPSLQPGPRADAEGGESVVIELPEYDLRRLITARDALCCVHAFMVMARVLFPSLYGFRMCPKCPHCVESAYPCMDRFGSNATPMGGSAGRGDAIIGAVEAQQAEGVLHLHLFLFVEMVNQHATLQEVAEMFEKQLLSIDAIKAFHSYVRCAALPDVDEMEAQRDNIEEKWPAYANDKSLSLLPAEFWSMGRDEPAAHPWQDASTCDAWKEDGAKWSKRYDDRVQHTFSRMNHHIHPLNQGTGERQVLKACKPKNTKANVCKGGFPLESEMTDEPLLVCRCIANEKELPQRGTRSMLGGILSERNWSYLNAGPRALVAFMGDNADVKFTQKYPILAQTHEATWGTAEERKTCLSARNNRDMSDR
jgi:hypothetical protein